MNTLPFDRRLYAFLEKCGDGRTPCLLRIFSNNTILYVPAGVVVTADKAGVSVAGVPVTGWHVPRPRRRILYPCPEGDEMLVHEFYGRGSATVSYQITKHVLTKAEVDNPFATSPASWTPSFAFALVKRDPSMINILRDFGISFVEAESLDEPGSFACKYPKLAARVTESALDVCSNAPPKYSPRVAEILKEYVGAESRLEGYKKAPVSSHRVLAEAHDILDEYLETGLLPDLSGLLVACEAPISIPVNEKTVNEFILPLLAVCPELSLV